MVFIGIDNGVSGSIGIISPERVDFFKTPVFRALDYTKKKKFLNRIDGTKMHDGLFQTGQVVTMIERPMLNPTRWTASISAARALEATLVCLEWCKIPYQFIDSKEWQRSLLPSGLKGPDLKAGSLDVAKRLFPQIDFKGFKDVDGLMIAEHCRRTFIARNWGKIESVLSK